MKRGHDAGGYGVADEAFIRDEKLGEGRCSAAAGVTPAIPTNHEPSQSGGSAKAGAEAVATWPETELITTTRAAGDLPRDAAEREARRAVAAPGAPDERIAAAFAICQVGQSRSSDGQGRIRWADESDSDSDSEWFGHMANVPSVSDVQIARSALRSCVARDPSRSFVDCR